MITVSWYGKLKQMEPMELADSQGGYGYYCPEDGICSFVSAETLGRLIKRGFVSVISGQYKTAKELENDKR